MNLIVVFSRKCRWPEHYFSVWSLGNSQKLLKKTQFLVSTIFFAIMNISFFSLRFDLFSIIAKEVNQIRNDVVCAVARLVFWSCCALTAGSCNAFQQNFVNLKKLDFYELYFQTVISCDYGLLRLNLTLILIVYTSTAFLKIMKIFNSTNSSANIRGAEVPTNIEAGTVLSPHCPLYSRAGSLTGNKRLNKISKIRALHAKCKRFKNHSTDDQFKWNLQDEMAEYFYSHFQVSLPDKGVYESIIWRILFL